MSSLWRQSNVSIWRDAAANADVAADCRVDTTCDRTPRGHSVAYVSANA